MYLPMPTQKLLFSAAFDPRISLIWNTLHGFCAAANDSQTTMTLEYFEETFIASIYALLRLTFDAKNTLSEIMRLAMISFTSTVFLHAPGTNIGFPKLVRDLQSALLLANGYGLGAFGRCEYELRLWVLWITSMGAAAEGGVLCDGVMRMLRQILWEGRVGSWDEVRAVLGKGCWIGGMCNGKGESVFQML